MVRSIQKIKELVVSIFLLLLMLVLMSLKKQGGFSWEDYIASLADFPILTSQWTKNMVNEITDKIPHQKIKKVLEVGCSNGRWVRWFCKEYSCEGYGLDNNPSGFKNKDINFMMGDAFKLPYQDNVFDVVFSLGLIEHFEKPKILSILKEQSRVLKTNGFLLCEIPYLDISLEYIYAKIFCDFRGRLLLKDLNGNKHYRIPEKELTCRFKQLNLEIISSKYTGYFFFERFISRKLRWFFERLNIPKLSTSRFTSTNYILI